MPFVEQIDVRSTRREEMIDITSLVRAALKKLALIHGMLWIYCPHTTAAITINENTDPVVKTDLLGLLSRLIPKDGGFAHAEGNADAHIKASLIGASTAVPVHNGKFLLGTWQAIFFCEFDGPRTRRVLCKALSSEGQP